MKCSAALPKNNENTLCTFAQKRKDHSGFIMPKELLLTGDSCLHEAIEVFYKAGGRDFFAVMRPEKYASNWLNFVGDLYNDIESGVYKSDGAFHRNPLSDEESAALREQGVPDLFLDDLAG